MPERAWESPRLTGPLPEMHQIRVRGRLLIACASGAPDGHPAVLFHGSPGSPEVPRPTHEQLQEEGIWLLGYYRPGYGGSDPINEDYTFKDAARDYEAVLDYFEVERASVVGRSGGGPFALACAALSKRVIRAAALVSPAPPDELGEQRFLELGDANTRDYKRTLNELKRELDERVRRMHEEGPQVLLDVEIGPDLSQYDSVLLLRYDGRLREQVLAGYVMGLCLDSNPTWTGWYTDSLMIHRRPWGFDPRKIQVPTLVALAKGDPFVPAVNGLWLAQHILGAREENGGVLVYGPEGSHFFASDPKEVLAVLKWCGGESYQPPERPDNAV
jgi:Predicted hydrolases or acyltransferases (alpha/beta hydrolase superfamily)